MKKSNRRTFLKNTVKLALTTSILPNIPLACKPENFIEGYIMTVNGKINPSDMGFTLSHEHILVDFIGATQYDPGRWDHDEVIRVVIPYIQEIIDLGCKTFIECTPEYIGRDPVLLRKIADQTGINILTNTGCYGASDNKYIPESAYAADAYQLADLWIKDFEYGIDGSEIRPGFMKIGVAPDPLSELHKKLITAAGITHIETGLTIASHTGPAVPAFEQIDILKSMGILPDAFIWVHAQNEKDSNKRLEAARKGAWVSIDGFGINQVAQYTEWLAEFKEKGLLNKVLVSHDAGWYSPGEQHGGDFTPYSSVFKYLIPELRKTGFSEKEIEQIFIRNPGEAFSVKIRKT